MCSRFLFHPSSFILHPFAFLLCLMSRPIFATIHLAALQHNLAVVRRHAACSKVLAVLKANAYGHGLARAARAFSDADGFGLLEIESAIALRQAGFRQHLVLLEGPFAADELPLLAQHDVAAVVHSREQVEMLAALPVGAKLDVYVKLNTGMNRLGFPAEEFAAVRSELARHPGIRGITLMTHFANADDARGVGWQMQALERAGAGPGVPRSCANSAAILRYPETHADWVRPGIMLYGCSPFAGRTGAEDGLQPAMTVASRLIALQHLKRGDAVGYGGAFAAERDMRVGVVACGYADGYPRHAPTGTPIMVEGRMTRTLGRISMDMLCADLSDIPPARVGSPVVLWGAEVPVERVAAAAGTVGYQLLCALAPRVQIVEK
jgi:alanine racemase